MTPEEREKQEEERLIAQEEEVQKQAESNATAEAVTTAGGGYVPATTWDGLEMIGGAEGWWEEAWDRENQFEGYVTLAVRLEGSYIVLIRGQLSYWTED